MAGTASRGASSESKDGPRLQGLEHIAQYRVQPSAKGCPLPSTMGTRYRPGIRRRRSRTLEGAGSRSCVSTDDAASRAALKFRRGPKQALQATVTGRGSRARARAREACILCGFDPPMGSPELPRKGVTHKSNGDTPTRMRARARGRTEPRCSTFVLLSAV